MTMINFTNVAAAALALGLAFSAAASPALAAKKRAANPGHAAHAQSIPGDATMTPDRERALRECSDMGNRYDNKTWGVYQSQMMRSCMTGRGQME